MTKMNWSRIFYKLKPVIPRSLQIFLRRKIAIVKRKKNSDVWPIDPMAYKPPDGWSGWPKGKKFALLLCHDVDTQRGHDNCLKIAKIEKQMGFRACYNFVPERYCNQDSVFAELRKKGFEIGVHGLKHDGKLFASREIFEQRAARINDYIAKWNANGFTSPSMHHNPKWLHLLNITHSTSTFDTDPFEPQPDGVGTIFPIWMKDSKRKDGYVELPYTLPQDHLLFIILREKNITIWKKKLDWIASFGGMALLNTHTDYMRFEDEAPQNETYPVEYYLEFLEYIKKEYSDEFYHALPSELAGFLIKSMQSSHCTDDAEWLYRVDGTQYENK